jgi:hypothetical protein
LQRSDPGLALKEMKKKKVIHDNAAALYGI